MTLAPGYSLAGVLNRALGRAEPAPRPTALDPTAVDAYWMGEALGEAMAGNGRANPNPAVGCVIVRDGECIARGATEAYGGRHAERVALDSLTDPAAARGATLYCTLEPCCHQGRQPPCVNRVLEAGIARCVIAVADPNPLVDQQGIRKLRRHGVEVRVGVLADEVGAWHLPFLHWQRRRRPLLAAKWAQTLDGQLAYDAGQPRWLSNRLSRGYAHWLRQRYDGILIGAGTALADRPSLTVRDCPPPHAHHPHRIVFDPNGRVLRCDAATWAALGETLFSAQATTLLACGEATLGRPVAARLRDLARRGTARLLPIPDGEGDPLNWVLSQAGEALAGDAPPLHSVLLEGGPRLLSQCFARELVDLAHVFIAPYLGGGARHRLSLEAPLIEGLGFHLAASHALDNDLLVEYLRSDMGIGHMGPRSSLVPAGEAQRL